LQIEILEKALLVREGSFSMICRVLFIGEEVGLVSDIYFKAARAIERFRSLRRKLEVLDVFML
jgi:hypothetical protein